MTRARRTQLVQPALPGEDIHKGEILHTLQLERVAEAEGWIGKQGELWQDSYHFLRARGLNWRSALIATWYSLKRDDRGELASVQALAEFLGITRQRVHQLIAQHNLGDWVGLLQFIRLGGYRLAEVDERSYQAASGAESSASDRRLYYERAGVLKQQINVGLGDDPLTALLRDLRKEGSQDDE